MSPDLVLITHETLCAALFYSVFCRAVRSCEKVRLDVRAAFFAMGSVACVGMAAPLAWGFIPDGFGLALLASIVVVQFVTARHWAITVPDRFYRPEHTPRRRRSSDQKGGKNDHARAA